ncbi:hypothetical protein CLV36_11438 [Laceyella sediminis]|uniref:Uncharacterized protein n=1 Tax=Laceyella sediminis TaxID=573074 RepID=A0ABX5ELJ7_9BACL|nr:hypothetical protein CLV36_11438 [Laceyella sediminis]
MFTTDVENRDLFLFIPTKKRKIMMYSRTCFSFITSILWILGQVPLGNLMGILSVIQRVVAWVLLTYFNVKEADEIDPLKFLEIERD